MSPELSYSCRRYSLAYIKKATNNFTDAIGTGGFGTVYRGTFPGNPNPTTVAVKRLKEGSNQGDPQFRAEIQVLSKCHHRHIVPLVGYCDELNEKILVYEYVPGGPLFHHLHRSTTVFTMEQRLEICLGVARGLDHLHSATDFVIIHRDVKTSNILIDDNRIAKISDLGLARVSLVGHTGFENTTMVIRGSFGYIDPQYIKSCKPSTKFDVYAFGVVLLEVLCRRRAWEEGSPSLVDWALPRIKAGGFSGIIDPKLKKNVWPDCSKACEAIITGCLQDDLGKRPSMSRVVADLDSALARQQGTHPSSSLFSSEIRDHFNQPDHHLHTITETDIGGGDRANSPKSNHSSYHMGTGDGIVLYYTSLRAFPKIRHDCADVREILSEYGKHVDERDVNLDTGYKEEIQEVLGGKLFNLPQLFIGGNHIGGVDKVKQLHEVGDLEKLVRRFPAKKRSGYGCRRCGDARFVGCPEEGCTNGSCGKCNHYGLVRCPSCSSSS